MIYIYAHRKLKLDNSDVRHHLEAENQVVVTVQRGVHTSETRATHSRGGQNGMDCWTFRANGFIVFLLPQ